MEKINQINANDKGLLAHVREQQELAEEMSKISGIPKKYFGNNKFVTNTDHILCGIEFAKKLKKILPK